MARVTNNIVTTGLSGKIGNLVFRKRGNKTSVYVLTQRKAPLSEKQKDAQLRFAAAVNQAKATLATNEGKLRFTVLAKEQGRESAYSAAVAYFMNMEKGK
jgi:uncharacterized membrane protein YfhO